MGCLFLFHRSRSRSRSRSSSLHLSRLFAATAMACCYFSSSLWAAGLEKSVLWSAEYAAKAGAASSSVSGADGLYFNPAGLVRGSDESEQTLGAGERQGQVSLNFSPTFSQAKGPITRRQEKLTGERTFSPVSAALASYRWNQRWGAGLGFYTAGGGAALFENVDFSQSNAAYNTLKPKVENDMRLMELGLGVGYQYNPQWRFGAVWRISIARAEFSSSSTTDYFLAASTIKDLKDEDYSGVRLGTQYTSADKNWGLGLTYRNQVDFKAKGTASGDQEWNVAPLASLDKTALTGGGTTYVETTLPQKISLGGHYHLLPTTTLFVEYDWAQYSQLKSIKIYGTPLLLRSNDDVLANGAANIDLKWKDQHSLRLGVEYSGINNWQLRAGHIYTSQVTNKDYASALFIAPGNVYSFLAGAGTTFKQKKVAVDGACEYAFVEGDGKTSKGGYTGTFSGTTFAFHLSGKYNF